MSLQFDSASKTDRFICSDLPFNSIDKCFTQNSSATLTDHRPNMLQIFGKDFQRPHFGMTSQTRKPRFWKMFDTKFNSIIRSRLGLQEPSTPDLARGFHLYTDGSCKVVRRKALTAGWSFALFGVGAVPVDEERLLVGALGPVFTRPTCKFYIGSKHRTNNTAELSAFIEAMLFMLGHAGPQDAYFTENSSVHLHTDSKYVKGLVEHKFQPRENIPIASLAVHLYDRVRRHFQVHINCVPGHSAVFGNDLVDQNAKHGADTSYRDSLWRRHFILQDWGADEYADFLKPVGAVLVGDSVCIDSQRRVAKNKQSAREETRKEVRKEIRKEVCVSSVCVLVVLVCLVVLVVLLPQPRNATQL